MVYQLLYVGVGGLLGSCLRYLFSLLAQYLPFAPTYPMGTLASNGLSCFVIGIVTQLAARSELVSPEARLLLATGFCGGLSTLSSVVYEVAQMLKDREFFYAAGYFTLTFGGAFLCFFSGVLVIQLLLKN